MKSEFRDFLLLLWKIVRGLLELSLYIFCFILFIISFALPSRWCHIVTHSRPSGEDIGDIRLLWLAHFMCTLLDVITLPLAIVGALVPTRTYKHLSLLLSDKQDSGEWGYSFKLRCAWVCLFFAAIVDAFFLPFFVFALLVPSRTLATLKSTWKAAHKAQDDNVDVCCFSQCWFVQACTGFLDLLSCVFGFVAFATGIRSYQTCREVRAAHGDPQDSKLLREFDYNMGVRWALIKNGALVLIDVFFVPLMLVTVLTPWRFQVVLTELKKGVTFEARMCILQQFGHALVDLILFVPSVLLVLTGYRSKILWDFWTGNTGSLPSCCCPNPSITAVEDLAKSEGCIFTRGQMLVFQASGLLLLDVLCLPSLILLFLSGYRFCKVARPRAGIEFHKSLMTEFASLLLDIPCFLIGLLLICTVYRADFVVQAFILRWQGPPRSAQEVDEECPKDEQASANHPRDDAEIYDDSLKGDCLFRVAIMYQAALFVRDVFMLVPIGMVLVTLYRAPALVLALKVKLSKCPTGSPLMQPLSCQATIPKPKGKPRLDIRASKEAELCGLQSVRLRILGDEFWNAVANSMGQLKASGAQSLMPFTLNARNLDLASIMPGSTEANLSIEFDTTVTFENVLSELKKLPGNVKAVLQFEATLEDGRHSILLAWGLPICAVVSGLQTGEWPVDSVLNSTQVEALQPKASSSKPKRDKWWSVVAAEAVVIAVDLLHGFLALLLMLFPWRFLSAMTMLFEAPSQRSARLASEAMAALQELERSCRTVADKVGPFLNKSAKKWASGRCQAETPGSRSSRGTYCEGNKMDWEIGLEQEIACWCCLLCPECPNYPYFPGEEPDCWRREGQDLDTIEHWLYRQSKPLTCAGKRLEKALENWPEEAQWQTLRTKLDAHLTARAEELCRIMVPYGLHKARLDDLKDEHYPLAAERAGFDSMQLHKQCKQNHELLLTSFKTKCKKVRSSCNCSMRPAPLCREIIRNQLLKGISDLVAVPALLLLILSVYRVPELFRDISELPVRNPPAIKRTLKKNLIGFAWDILVFLELLVLVVILTATVVKLPDFLSGMRPHMGLRANVGWAVLKVHELVMGIVELLFLLTAWKTYRLALSAATFAALCPATMLAMALPERCNQKCRFAFASVLWIGILLLAVFVPPVVPNQGALSVLTLGALACLGLQINGAQRWASPAAGDWWSASVRWTAPNLFVLLSVMIDAAVLSIIALGQEDTFRVIAGETVTNVAFGVVLVFVLLTTAPWVGDDDERQKLISHISWRSAVAILREVLFLPLVWILLQAPDSILKTLATMFFLYFATFVGTSCDVPVTRNFGLDLCSPEFFVAGTRLLLACSVFCSGSKMSFLSTCSVLCLWTISWGSRGCSALWVQVLRLGVGMAAILGSFQGITGVLIASSAILVAFVVGSVAQYQRWKAMQDTEIPALLQAVRRVQGRLSIWGDRFDLPLGSSAQELANHLLLLEDCVPLERLTKTFMTDRPQWRKALRAASEYKEVKEALQKLASGISTPWPTTALTQLLCQVPVRQRSYFPRDLAALVVSFVDDVEWSALRIEISPASVRPTYIDLQLLFRTAQDKSKELVKSLANRTSEGKHHSEVVVDIKDFLSAASDIIVEKYPKALGGFWGGKSTL